MGMAMMLAGDHLVTVTAKTHLLLSATLLYGEPWPRESGVFLLRVAGVGLAVLALLSFPRHERRARFVRYGGSPPPPPAPSAAPSGLLVGVESPDVPRALPAAPPARPSNVPPSQISAPPSGWPVAPSAGFRGDGRWVGPRGDVPSADPSHLG